VETAIRQAGPAGVQGAHIEVVVNWFQKLIELSPQP
jgi:hypothetical protein